MSEVGQGTLLAGRYRLEERLTQADTSSLWRALDTTLDRAVAVRVIAPRVAAETLDAARRAALVDDPRLVRVLDVARQPDPKGEGSTTYVVSEWVEGRSVADLLAEDGPLQADQIRTLVGEAAEALTVAAGQGLHHLALDPTSVLLTRDGTVKLHGIAVDAATEGRHLDGTAAERVDAVGLVALAYAGLTGRWPLPGATRGAHPVDPAPISGNTPVPPADLVAGVPNDLDTLCTVTFGPHDDGPRNPAELAAQLRPWKTPSGHGAGANRRLADDLRSAPRRPPSRFPVRLNPTEVEIDHQAARAALTPGTESLLEPRPQPVDATPPDPQAVRQSRVAIAAIAALVLIGLVLAIFSLSSLGGDAPVATTPSPTTPSVSAPPPVATPEIAAVTAFDPEGGDGENDDAAALAIDGNPETVWNSSTYKSSAFGGLKSGVGLVVTLSAPATVNKVTVQARGDGGVIQVRSATGPTLEGSQVLGEGSGTFEVSPTPAPTTNYLIIWCTELPRTDGANRLEIAEVRVQ